MEIMPILHPFLFFLFFSILFLFIFLFLIFLSFSLFPVLFRKRIPSSVNIYKPSLIQHHI